MAGAVTQTFVEVFESLAGHAHVVADIEEAAAVAARILKEAEVRKVALASLPDALRDAIETHCNEAGIDVLMEPFQSDGLPEAVDAAQVGITGNLFAIAETGTLVEIATDDATRLVSALPRTHIGVVLAKDLIPTLMEAAPRMRAALEAHPDGVSLSFLSGPSRTGDIEMKLTLGVHGPETAYAIIVEESAS